LNIARRTASDTPSKYPTHDHIVPVSKGGKHTWDNAQLAHFECNTKKNAKLPEVAYA
jgi:5-methylcytosine-specific restriction endonuclease McrA